MIKTPMYEQKLSLLAENTDVRACFQNLMGVAFGLQHVSRLAWHETASLIGDLRNDYLRLGQASRLSRLLAI